MSSEEFSITWNDHPRTVMGLLGRYLDEGTLVDCTIAAEGKHLKAHRLILSACSSYFELLFCRELKEENVVLQDIKFKDLILLIVFMYEGEVTVPKEGLQDFVRAAESLQIRGLRCDLVLNSLKEETEMSVECLEEGLASQLSHNHMRCSAIEPSRSMQMDVSEESVFSESQSILESDSNRKAVFPAEKEPSVKPMAEVDVEDTAIWESEVKEESSVTDLFTSATADEEIRVEFSPILGTISSYISCANSSHILQKESVSSIQKFSTVSATSADTACSSLFVCNVPSIQGCVESGSSYVWRDLAEQSICVQNEPVVRTAGIPAEISLHRDRIEYPIHAVFVEEVQSSEGDEVITKTDFADTCHHETTNENLEVAAFSYNKSAELFNLTDNDFASSCVVVQKDNEEVSAQELKKEDTETDKQFMRLKCKSIDDNDRTVDRVVESGHQGFTEIDDSVQEGQKMVEAVERALETDVAVEQSEVEDEDSAPLSERIFKMGGKKSHRCSECLDVFHTVSDLRLHMKNIHKSQCRHRCEVCKATFAYRCQLMRHMRTHSAERPFHCDVCQKAFPYRGNLSVHMRLHSGERAYQCVICKRSFKCKSHLCRHMQTHSGKQSFQCDVCTMSFSQKDNLNRHKRIHTGECPFQCDVCKRFFGLKANLAKHMRTHTGERPFQCKVCEKAFSSKSYLTAHERIHTGDRPFQCDVCMMSFSENSDLNVHKLIHAGEHPYQCDVCKRSFNFKSNLKSHMRTHSGERPFQCEVCKRSFSHKGSLNTHMHTHSGERPFRCDVCTMSFNQNCNLNRHKKAHTGERPFHCDVCKMSFNGKSNLSTHMRTHTG